MNAAKMLPAEQGENMNVAQREMVRSPKMVVEAAWWRGAESRKSFSFFFNNLLRLLDFRGYHQPAV